MAACGRRRPKRISCASAALRPLGADKRASATRGGGGGEPRKRYRRRLEKRSVDVAAAAAAAAAIDRDGSRPRSAEERGEFAGRAATSRGDSGRRFEYNAELSSDCERAKAVLGGVMARSIIRGTPASRRFGEMLGCACSLYTTFISEDGHPPFIWSQSSSFALAAGSWFMVSKNVVCW